MSVKVFTCIGGSIGTVLFAGFASGMTIGLLSLDSIQLRVLKDAGTEEEKRKAQVVLEVTKDHHLLLVTLLLANSIAMELLPLFLDRIVPMWVALLLSVTTVLFFGEVVPQALCTGRYQLKIAAASAPFVSLLVYILYPIAAPVARILDYCLGQESQTHYARAHLKALIKLHGKEPASDSEEEEDQIRRPDRQRSSPSDTSLQYEDASEGESHLRDDEVGVIQGALDLAAKSARELMIPFEEVFCLEYNTPVSTELLDEVLEKGHSRVPIFIGTKDNVRHVLLVKSLITAERWMNQPVGYVAKRQTPMFIHPKMEIWKLLKDFRKGRTHMAIVTDTPEVYEEVIKNTMPLPSACRVLGVLTLEDVIEELLQEEIFDEFDRPIIHLRNRTSRSFGSTSIIIPMLES